MGGILVCYVKARWCRHTLGHSSGCLFKHLPNSKWATSGNTVEIGFVFTIYYIYILRLMEWGNILYYMLFI